MNPSSWLSAYNSAQSSPTTAALSAAVGLVEAYLCPDTPGVLTEAQRVATVRLVPPCNVGYMIGPEYLKAWPITGLVSVVVDGANITSQCSFDASSVRRGYAYGHFPQSTDIVITFTTGYTSSNIPAAIKSTVLALADRLIKTPDGITSKALGDARITYAEAARSLSDAEKQALAPFRVVMF